MCQWWHGCRVMILIRTTEFTQSTADLVRTLTEASGRDVAILADERTRRVDTGNVAKVSLTDKACQEIGLFTPDDFAWRCGDYGFYLARRQFPDVESFWIVENDVMISVPELFFRWTDAQPQIDLLAAYLKPANSDWWWYGSAASRDAIPHRCLFPLVRLSSVAIDHLERKRVAHSRRLLKRLLWPNDEIFVATTLAHARLKFSDLNSFSADLYDESSYAFDLVLDGDRFTPPANVPRLYHSVLRGQALKAKLERVCNFSRPKPLRERLIRKAVPRLNCLLKW